MLKYRQIYAISIHSFSETMIQKGFSFIPIDKREKLREFEDTNDRLRSLAGELLVRLFVCSMFQQKNEDVKIVYGEDGKPSIMGFPSFHFNISHAEEWVVIIADNKAIGIDIEYQKEIDFIKVARRFYSDEEQMRLFEKINRKNEFYKIWTLKESFIKAVGKGLTLPLTTFSVITSKGLCPVSYQNVLYKFQEVPFYEGYSLSVCYLNQKPINEVSIVDIETLLQTLSIYITDGKEITSIVD